MNKQVLTCIFFSICIQIFSQTDLTIQISKPASLPILFEGDNCICDYFVNENEICVTANMRIGGILVRKNEVRRYNKNTLEFISSNLMFPKGSIEKDFMEMKFEEIVTLNNQNYAIIKKENKALDTDIYYAIALNKEFSPIDAPKLITTIQRPDNWNPTKVYENKNHDGFVIIRNFLINPGSKKIKIGYYTYDSNFTRVSTGESLLWQPASSGSNMEFPYQTIKSIDAELFYDDVENYEKNEYEKNHKYNIEMLNPMNGMQLFSAIENIEHPTSIEAFSDDDFYYIGGFFKTDQNVVADGFYLYTISKDNMTITSINKKNLKQSFINSLIYSKSDHLEYKMWGARMKQVFSLADGGKYIVGEQYQNYIGSDAVYDVHLFHKRGSIIIIKIDKNGEIEWCSHIPRRVYSHFEAYTDISVHLVNNKIFIFYTDKEFNFKVDDLNDIKTANLNFYSHDDGQLVGVIVKENGDYTKYKLANPEDNNKFRVFNNNWIKLEGENTWVNSVFYNKGTEVGLAKITYNEN